MEPKGSTMYVVLYNALGTNRSQIVRLPVSTNGTFKVSRVGDAGNSIISAIPSPFDTHTSAKYVLPFASGPITPVGVTVFQITQTDDRVNPVSLHNPISASAPGDRSLRASKDNSGVQEEVIVSNGDLTVRFDRYVGHWNFG